MRVTCLPAYRGHNAVGLSGQAVPSSRCRGCRFAPHLLQLLQHRVQLQVWPQCTCLGLRFRPSCIVERGYSTAHGCVGTGSSRTRHDMILARHSGWQAAASGCLPVLRLEVVAVRFAPATLAVSPIQSLVQRLGVVRPKRLRGAAWRSWQQAALGGVVCGRSGDVRAFTFCLSVLSYRGGSFVSRLPVCLLACAAGWLFGYCSLSFARSLEESRSWAAFWAACFVVLPSWAAPV